MNIINNYEKILNDLESHDQVVDYLVDLGDQLPEVSTGLKVKPNYIRGCQSHVWAKCQHDGDRNYYNLHSDSRVVRGICKILLDVYNTKTTKEIKDITYYNFRNITKHFTAQRQRGTQAIINRIHKLAKS